jgi:hypothetical protein
MEVWSHDGKQYELNSYYNVIDNAWQYELVGTAEPTFLAIVIPDSTPDGDRFVPAPSDDVLLAAAGGTTPWPILMGLVDRAESSGDIVEDTRWRLAAASDRPLITHTVWTHHSKIYEINSFYFGDRDAWCYELCLPHSDPDRNDYLAVLIPDADPGSGPFVPVASDRITCTVHGDCAVPWPVFRRFIEAISTDGRQVIIVASDRL